MKKKIYRRSRTAVSSEKRDRKKTRERYGCTGDFAVVRLPSSKKSGSLIALAALSGALLMMLSPSEALESARKAVNLWFFTVLPSMLPFFICTDLLVRSGFHVQLGNLFEGPFRRLYGVPGVAGLVYMSSIISGYPAGAKILGELHERGQIRKEDVKNILSFCSTSGPLFILGAVGSGMLRSVSAGYLILCAHYLGSLLTGLLVIRQSALRRALSPGAFAAGVRRAVPERGPQEALRGEMPRSGGVRREMVRNGTREDAGQNRNGHSLSEVMTKSILSSFQSLLVIGGYIVIFMILTDAAKRLLRQVPEGDGLFADLLAGCLEMTVGCSGAAESNASMEWKIVACAFLISFGGLSVAAQSLSVLKNSGVRLSYYLRFKLLQGLISAVCAYTMIKISSDYSGGALFVFESADLPAGRLTGFDLFSADGAASLYSLIFSSAAAAAMLISFYLAAVLFSGRRREDEGDGNHSGI